MVAILEFEPWPVGQPQVSLVEETGGVEGVFPRSSPEALVGQLAEPLVQEWHQVVEWGPIRLARSVRWRIGGDHETSPGREVLRKIYGAGRTHAEPFSSWFPITKVKGNRR
jgi:hypothetical protein